MAVVDHINAVWAIDGNIGVFSSALLQLLRAISGSGYSRMVLGDYSGPARVWRMLNDGVFLYSGPPFCLTCPHSGNISRLTHLHIRTGLKTWYTQIWRRPRPVQPLLGSLKWFCTRMSVRSWGHPMVYHALALLCRGLAAGFKFP
jgi:hypothetical protein